jgi:hypothetical protein
LGLTKEERIAKRKARAESKMKKLREASKSGNLTDRMDWRPKAKIVLHPDTEIKPRRRIWFPKVVDVKDDEKDGKKSKKGSGKTKVVSVPFNVPFDTEKCPFALLSKILRERDDIDGEDNIICVGTGRNKVELCKGEILGWKGYDFKKSLKVNNDFVAAAVMLENAKKKRPSNLKAVIFSAAKSLGTEITKEIESEMDESGEEAGCPFITPYPFIIKYDEDERGSDMYSASARPQETDDVAEDAELMKILNDEPPDIEPEIELSSVSEMLKAINSSIIYDGLKIEMEGVKEDEKDSKTDKSAAKGKSKKSSTKNNSKVKEESENQEPEESEDPAPETVSDEDAEAQAQAELEAEAEAEAEIQAAADAELEAEALAEIEKEEADKKKAEAAEAAAKKAKLDAAKKAAAKKKAEVAAKKKKKAKELTKEEKKAALVAKKKAEILAKKKAAAVKKEKAKKEEKPKKSSKKVKDEAETEVGWEPADDEEHDICPVCKGKVPVDAVKCPHPGCEAIFAPEGDEPF